MMSYAVLSSVLLGLQTAVTTTALPTGTQVSASIKETPYFASIELNGEYACAATIVDDRYVLTTNSCVAGLDVHSMWVRVGTDKMGRRGQLFKATSITPFSSSSFMPTSAVDAAMAEVAVSFQYDSRVMWLNPNLDGVQEMQEGVVTSWANPKIKGSPLVLSPAIVLPSANCSEIYKGVLNISSTMFCLSPKDSNSHLCIANLGDPFFYNEQYYGLVTYSPGCSDSALPVVITAISSTSNFIMGVLCNMLDFTG